MTLRTNEMSINECTQQLVDMLVARVYIERGTLQAFWYD